MKRLIEDLLVEQYFDLLKYCSSLDFNFNKFKALHDNYAKAYSSDLSFEQSGYVTEKISERISETV